MSTTRPQARGLFLSFEGGEGSGKSTQMRLLIDRLTEAGFPPLVSAEPGGTPIGQQIRRVLLDSKNGDLSPRAELLLYFAARAQNVEQWIRPALAEGRIVVSDRFTDSTLAYQGGGRGLGEELVWQLHQIACQEVMPDLTLYLDMDYRSGLARALARNAAHAAANLPDENRFEAEAESFHEQVRQAYLGLASRFPQRIRTIDASGTVDQVAEAIWQVVSARLPRKDT